MLICVIFALLYLYISPPTSSPDEIAHLSYPRFLLYEKQLPSFQTSQDFWESHQPPLYYFFSTPFVKAFSIFSIENQLQLDRLASFVLYLIGLYSFFILLKKLFPEKQYIQSSAILFLGIPMIGYLAGSFSNDIGMLLISIWACYWVFYKSQTNFVHKQAIFFGIFFGAGLLTKIHVYPILLVCAIFVLWKKPFFLWVEACLSALFISLWWFIHNIQTTGDFFGLSNTFILWKSQQAPFAGIHDAFILCGKLFSGFWGVFGKFNIAYPQVIYAFLVIISILLCIYSLKYFRNAQIKKIFIIIITAIVFVIVQNFTFYQPQGRYLITLAPFIGLLYAFSAQHANKKFVTPIFIVIIFLITTLNSLSLLLIHSYYQKNPIASFTYPRSINLLQKNFQGDETKIQKVGGVLVIHAPATIYTLQDMRLDTQKKPYIHFTSQNNDSFTLTIKWKRLGDTTFSNSRSIQSTIHTSGDVKIPEKEKTLIQDIEVEFTSDHDTITLTEFYVGVN